MQRQPLKRFTLGRRPSSFPIAIRRLRPNNSRRSMRYPATRPTADEIRTGKAHISEIAGSYGRKAQDIGITVREPFKIDEGLPAERNKPFIGPRSHVMDSFHEFRELGVNHMVIDLFYSTSVLEDATLDSMLKAMEVLA